MTQISLCGSELELHFQFKNERLHFTQMRRGEHSLLQPGAVGNPLGVVISSGEHAGHYGPDSFRVTHLQHDETSLLAYLQHDTLPLLFGLSVGVEGNVMSWRGQVGWNGAQSVEIDFYFPLWSKVVLDSPDADRAIFATLSGDVVGPRSRADGRD